MISANSLAHTDGGMVTTKALDITNSIVQAHIKREKVLSGEHYGSIKHLISERIRWHRTQAEWEPTIGWCDTLVALLSDSLDEKEGAVAVLVLKVDAFIRQGRYPDAVKLSAETFAMLPNTRTILMRFKALVHADSPQVAVDAFQEMHRSLLDTSNTVTAASVANPYLSSTAEYLSRIVLCCGVLKDSPALNDVKRDKITELMVREWVQRYGAEHMWEEAGEYKDSDSMLIDTTPTAAPVCTYFGMVCDYMHMYLAHVMELRPATTAQDSNKMEVISVEAAVRCFVTDGGEERRGGDSEFTAASIASSLSAPVVGASQATDFFTFYGYPDSLNAAAASAEGCEFIFSCPLNVLRKDVLVLLEDMISTIAALERSDQPITVLGNAQDLTWLKRLANNLAVVLLRRSGQVYKNSDTPLRLVTAARFFEISQFLGSKQVAGCASGGGYGESGSESATDLAAALINASACRIDAEPSVPSQQSSSSRHELTLSSVTQSGVDVMLQPGTSGSSHPAETASAPLTSGIPSNNLAQARMDVQEADRLLQALSDFDDPRAKRLQNMALVIEFAAVCKAGNQRQCEGFLRERHNAFLRQSASELRRCAHVAREEVSMEAARSLMNLALQICVRDSGGSPDYRLMGALYAELIDTSPSRKHALQKVEEFEQLASNLTAPPSSASVAEPSDAVNTFAPDDVDNIVSRAYNNGVSLVDLDQLEMAETFVCKAISLLNLASPSLKGWLPKMQVTSLSTS